MHKNKAISQATSKGIRSIVDASVFWKDDVHRLLSEEFKDLTTLSESTGLIYHRLCFKSYISKRNLSFAKLEEDENKNRGKSEQKKSQNSEQGMEPPSGCTRSLSPSLNWTNCIAYQKRSHKKDRKLHRIESMERTEKLQNAAQRRNDLQMI